MTVHDYSERERERERERRLCEREEEITTDML